MNVSRKYIAQSICLDIRKLINKGYITKGKNSKRKFKIDTIDGQVIINIDSRLKNPKSMRLNLKYKMNKDSPEINLEIPVTTIKTNFNNGGMNLFFICPFSAIPVTILCLCDQTHLFVRNQSLNHLVDSRFPVNIKFPITDKASLELFIKQKRQAMDDKNEKLNEYARLHFNAKFDQKIVIAKVSLAI